MLQITVPVAGGVVAAVAVTVAVITAFLVGSIHNYSCKVLILYIISHLSIGLYLLEDKTCKGTG